METDKRGTNRPDPSPGETLERASLPGRATQAQTKAIIKQVRKASDEDTARLALELAKSHPVEILPELIRMAEGHRRTFFRNYHSHQIAAVDALVETGLEEALTYLQRIAKIKFVFNVREETLHGQGSGDCNPYTVSHYTFSGKVELRFAPNGLGGGREYELAKADSDLYDEEPRGDKKLKEKIEAGEVNICPEYEFLRDAIRKLKERIAN